MKNNRQEPNSFDDTYDEKSEVFGHPYKELQDYFNRYSLKGTLLDLGCGQGRDAVFLASLGYQVTAVDSSKIGIRQMTAKARAQEVKIDGVVADVLNLKLDKKFDIILFDMLLHTFEKQDQLELLGKYSKSLNKKGVFCIVFPDDLKTDHFLSLLKSLPFDWKLLDEVIIKDVPKIEGDDNSFTFNMMVVQKE